MIKGSILNEVVSKLGKEEDCKDVFIPIDAVTLQLKDDTEIYLNRRPVDRTLLDIVVSVNLCKKGGKARGNTLKINPEEELSDEKVEEILAEVKKLLKILRAE